MTRNLLTRWQLWALVAVLGILAVDVADHLTNFPVRLGMLRVGLLFAEQVWTKIRMIQ